MVKLYGVIAVLGTVLFAGSARAQITFDFEGQPATADASSAEPGALVSLVEVQAGVIFTLTRPGSRFDVVDASDPPLFPASFGARVLDPFFDDNTATPFFASFSQELTGASISFGDFGDDVDALTIRAFTDSGGKGSLVAVASASFSGDFFDGDLPAIVTLTSAVPFLSLELLGGSADFPNSVFYDNIVVTTAVPVPGPIAGAGLPALLTLAGVWYVRRRRER